MTDQEIEDGGEMKPDWDAFVEWLREDLELPNIPIKWSRYATMEDFRIIRVDLCHGKPYHVSVTFEDRPELCNHDVAYSLSQGILPVLSKAIDTMSPYTYIAHFDVRAFV